MLDQVILLILDFGERGKKVVIPFPLEIKEIGLSFAKHAKKKWPALGVGIIKKETLS